MVPDISKFIFSIPNFQQFHLILLSNCPEHPIMLNGPRTPIFSSGPETPILLKGPYTPILLIGPEAPICVSFIPNFQR